jgi:hypothetical protein
MVKKSKIYKKLSKKTEIRILVSNKQTFIGKSFIISKENNGRY